MSLTTCIMSIFVIVLASAATGCCLDIKGNCYPPTFWLLGAVTGMASGLLIMW